MNVELQTVMVTDSVVGKWPTAIDELILRFFPTTESKRTPTQKPHKTEEATLSGRAWPTLRFLFSHLRER